MTTPHDPELYVAQQTFFLAKDVLIGSADAAGQQCLLLFGDYDRSGFVMSIKTSLSDPCIQSSILRLFESLPLEVRKEVGRSLVQAE
jgi:hypothetical protein